MLLIMGSGPDIPGSGHDPNTGPMVEALREDFEVLGSFCTLLLWIMLAILLFVGGIKGDIIRTGAAVLLLLSGGAMIYAADLHSRYGGWAITVPGLLPPLIVLYGV